MNTQHLHSLALEDAKSAVASIERLDYDNAYCNAKAVCENLLLLLEEEMYKGNNND
ncbi:MAG: hypothetical protein J6Y02_20205 [Pseudobutyrivibrio sp.]|nr:hypothetical protein [Pseudobutyrivibrio sp.]